MHAAYSQSRAISQLPLSANHTLNFATTLETSASVFYSARL